MQKNIFTILQKSTYNVHPLFVFYNGKSLYCINLFQLSCIYHYTLTHYQILSQINLQFNSIFHCIFLIFLYHYLFLFVYLLFYFLFIYFLFIIYYFIITYLLFLSKYLAYAFTCGNFMHNGDGRKLPLCIYPIYTNLYYHMILY